MRHRWLAKKEALAIHAMQLAWFGGTTGLRDEGVLDSALAHPRMMARRSEDTPALPVLAAAFAAGIMRDRPFNDGNQRTALVAAFAFLERNGLQVSATQQDAYEVFRGLATGDISQNELAHWLSANTCRVPK